MSFPLTLPAGSSIRITKGPGVGGRSSVVLVIAPPGLAATRENGLQRGRLTAAITFAAGQAWPDRIGIAMTADALAHGEMVTFHFETLADALRCEAALHQRDTAA